LQRILQRIHRYIFKTPQIIHFHGAADIQTLDPDKPEWNEYFFFTKLLPGASTKNDENTQTLPTAKTGGFSGNIGYLLVLSQGLSARGYDDI
jgi:hypothetical protein